MAFVSRFPSRNRFVTFTAKAVIAARRHFSSPDPVDALVAHLPEPENAATLVDKVTLVTGAGQGIGRVLSLALAARGARVALVARHRPALDRVAEEIGRTGGVAAVFVTDVGEPGSSAALFDAVEQRFGPVDILFNNAGIGGPWGCPFWEAGEEEVIATFATNLTAPFRMAREAASRARAGGRPLRIINVSSIATGMAMPGITAYATSKAGLEAMTRAMAADAGGSGITVCTVTLHSVRTERKAAHDWASNALLPPTEVVAPAFLHAATAPAAEVQGRTIAAWRMAENPEAEIRLAGPAAARRAIAYPPFLHKGEEVPRDPLRFSINDRAENPYGPSPAVAPAIAAALTRAPLSYYPDEHHAELTAALARRHGLPPGSFALGPGSWEVLSRLVTLFAQPGEEVVSNGPGWFGFNLVARRAGVKQLLAPFDLGEASGVPGHDLDSVLARITPQTRLVYLIHPSNPEGIPLRDAPMRRFLAALPPRLPVIVDEAYIEYAQGDDLFDTTAAIRRGGNTVIGLRTFSKFFALAGARVGYAYAGPEIAALIRASEHIFSISSPSEAAAVAALGDTGHAARVHALFAQERAHVTAGLERLGLAPLASEAPFVLACRPAGMEQVFERLEADGIYIARYAFHGDSRMMFPVATRDVNDQILAEVSSAG